jgi:hypothetical protein
VQPFKFDLLDRGGGHVDGIPATHIADREWSRLVNFFTYGPKIRLRGGITEVVAPASGETATSFFPYKNSSGDFTLLVGQLTGFSAVTTGVLTAVPLNGFTLNSDLRPAHGVQYKDVLLVARPNAGTLMRGTPSGFSRAGIAAPTVAPTLADGGAGSMIAGDYRVVYTFYNTATGQESNPSDPTTITLGASKKIDVSALQTSTSAQVDARRIYISVVNQEGEYFFAAMISDNFSTTVTLDITVDEYGDPVSFVNGLPPDNVEEVAVWRERAFVHDGRDVFYTPIGLVESFDPENIIRVNPDDGHRITALHPWIDRLIIAKQDSIHYLSGSTEETLELNELDTEHGCRSPHSMKSAAGQLFWYAGDEGFRRSRGGASEDMVSHKIRVILDAVPEDQQHMVTAAIFPRFNWYIAVVPQSSGSWKILAFDYTADSWSVLESTQLDPRFIGTFFNEDDERVLYVLDDDSDGVYLFNDESSYRDLGELFTAYARTKDLDGGRPTLMLGLRRTSLLCSRVDIPVDVLVYGGPPVFPDFVVQWLRAPAPNRLRLNLYRDGNHSAPAKFWNITLNSDDRWKPFSTAAYYARPSALIAMELEYKHDEFFELEGISLEGGLFNRSRVAGR